MIEYVLDLTDEAPDLIRQAEERGYQDELEYLYDMIRETIQERNR